MTPKDYLIKKKVERLAAVSATRPHVSVPLDKAGSLLFLYTEEDREEVEDCLNDFRKNYPGRMLITFCIGKKNGGNADDAIIQASRIRNFFGLPHPEAVRQFQSLQADILIDLTPSDCFFMKYLVLNHSCRFKVGIKSKELKNNPYDLAVSITTKGNIREIVEHLFFYLRSIRSK